MRPAQLNLLTGNGSGILTFFFIPGYVQSLVYAQLQVGNKSHKYLLNVDRGVYQLGGEEAEKPAALDRSLSKLTNK